VCVCVQEEKLRLWLGNNFKADRYGIAPFGKYPHILSFGKCLL